MAPTKSGWTKYGTDQIWLDQKWLRPNMGLEQIWVGPNMGPTKYAGPNLVRPKMADQKCLDQIWLDTALCSPGKTLVFNVGIQTTGNTKRKPQETFTI